MSEYEVSKIIEDLKSRGVSVLLTPQGIKYIGKDYITLQK